MTGNARANPRETAWRVFANELNTSTLEIKATEEKMPSYLVSPLGAKINRVLVAGTLTEKANSSFLEVMLNVFLSFPGSRGFRSSTTRSMAKNIAIYET